MAFKTASGIRKKATKFRCGLIETATENDQF